MPQDRVYTDPVDCYAYTYDNSRNYHSPITVVFPLIVEEVQSVIQLCNQHKVRERSLESMAYVGMAKRSFVPREIDATTMQLMKSLKLTFDPNNVLNPGKLFP